jgi:hypothetical protein
MAAVKVNSKPSAKPAAKAPVKPRVSALAAAVAEAGEAGNQNDLFPEPGDYEPKFLALNERPMNDGSAHQWVEAKFELEDGSEVSQLFCVSGKSRKRSAERIKQLCMALVGVPTVADFNAFDPHGEFIDCLLGFAESFEGTVGDEKVTITPSEYVGTKIRVKIQKGNETADGDWYREPTFRPLATEEEASE